jgi:hypothetical protein
MSKILFAQPIFAPDQKRLERNLNSIKSFGEYVKKYGTDGNHVTVIMGGWAKTDELWNEIVKECKTSLGENFNPIRFEKNYGKAIIVNQLVQNAKLNDTSKDFEYILTADSDILFPEETKYLFGRLVNMATNCQTSKHKPFGMISLQQLGAGCHWPVCYENNLTYTLTVTNEKGEIDTIEEKVVWPNTPSGIAGGCLFVSRLLWDMVNGYRVMGVYSGDDAYLLLDCGLKGFSYQMADTIAIIHPMEDDEEYAQWKHKVCGRDAASGPKTNIDHIIAEADEFWNNKK